MASKLNGFQFLRLLLAFGAFAVFVRLLRPAGWFDALLAIAFVAFVYFLPRLIRFPWAKEEK